MKRMKNNNGFTLIEIIISLAILGIIMVVFLNAFTTGATNIIYSGQKSDKVMDLQTIIDDLNAQVFYKDSTVPVTAKSRIEAYLAGNPRSYYNVADISQIAVRFAGEDVNFFVSGLENKAGTNGYTVTILKFTDNGKRYARISTFVLERGA